MMTRIVHVVVREDDPSWWAWSPQCPGLAIAEDSEPEILRSLPETIAWAFDGDEDFDLRVHVERVIEGVVIRVARDDQHAARQEVADRLVAALADQVLADRLRAGPRNWADEVVYVCGLPTDTRAWLDGQLEDGRDPVVVAVPVSRGRLWARPFDEQPALAATAPGEAANRTTFGELARDTEGERLLLCA